MEEDRKKISFEIKPEIAKGIYSNFAIISHSQSEFILDFACMLPGLSKPEILQRIVMTPEHAKHLMAALKDNIDRFESQNGPVSSKGAAAQFPLDINPKGAKS